MAPGAGLRDSGSGGRPEAGSAGPRGRAATGAAGRIAQHRPQLERWERLCAGLGQRPADVALAWLLQRPGVTAPIVGPRTLEQLEDALRAAELKLEPATIEAIESIWPGPGGEAPEAYAW